MLVMPIRVSTPLQFAVITGLSGHMLTFDGAWHLGDVWLCYEQACVVGNKYGCILLMEL